MLFLNALYLAVMQRMQGFFEEEQGNEQTGMLLNIVITVVLAGLVLTAINGFFPQLWDQIVAKINGLWNVGP